jgi:hypothetical protein
VFLKTKGERREHFAAEVDARIILECFERPALSAQIAFAW